MALPEMASVRTLTLGCTPRSAMRLWIPRHIAEPLVRAQNSASPLLRATTVRLVAQDLMTWSPSQHAPAFVERRVVLSPAQSESVMPFTANRFDCGL